MARATGGGVAYWFELPISELLLFMTELNEQILQERGSKGVMM
jgi:hypothetical protein